MFSISTLKELKCSALTEDANIFKGLRVSLGFHVIVHDRETFRPLETSEKVSSEHPH